MKGYYDQGYSGKGLKVPTGRLNIEVTSYHEILHKEFSF